MQPHHTGMPDKSRWLVGIGVFAIIQLLSAGGTLMYPDAIPFPPVRLSIIVGSQLLMALAVGLRNRFSNDHLLRHAILLGVLYAFGLYFTFRHYVDRAVTLHSVNPNVRIEADISAFLLVGLALLNTILFVRLSRPGGAKKYQQRNAPSRVASMIFRGWHR